jgi:hypothetical protein
MPPLAVEEGFSPLAPPASPPLANAIAWFVVAVGAGRSFFPCQH